MVGVRGSEGLGGGGLDVVEFGVMGVSRCHLTDRLSTLAASFCNLQ